jgi:hypothetical protein
MKNFLTAAAVVASLITAAPAVAATALDFTGPATVVTCFGCGGGVGSTSGWAFSVTSGITVTALGVWDDEADGLGASSIASLWNGAGTLLGSVNVTDASALVASALGSGGWRTEDLVSAIYLAPGNYAVGAQLRDDSPRVLLNASFATISEITFLGGRYSGGGTDSGVLFPGTGIGAVFGPTLFTAEFTADVPLPASALLLLGGIGALGAARRRRKG